MAGRSVLLWKGIQTRLKFKTEERWKLRSIERSFGQQRSVQQVFCQDALVPKGLRETFSNDFRDDMFGSLSSTKLGDESFQSY